MTMRRPTRSAAGRDGRAAWRSVSHCPCARTISDVSRSGHPVSLLSVLALRQARTGVPMRTWTVPVERPMGFRRMLFAWSDWAYRDSRIGRGLVSCVRWRWVPVSGTHAGSSAGLVSDGPMGLWQWCWRRDHPECAPQRGARGVVTPGGGDRRMPPEVGRVGAWSPVNRVAPRPVPSGPSQRRMRCRSSRCLGEMAAGLLTVGR